MVMASVISDLTSGAGTFIRDNKYAIMVLLLGGFAATDIVEFIQSGKVPITDPPAWVGGALEAVVGSAEERLGAPIFELLVTTPTGVALSSEPGAQEAQAVRMIQRMIGFAVGLPFATAQIKTALKISLGESASEAFAECFDKIGEEIGINWAIGSVMDRIIETAAATPIEEAIAEQTRPQRMEWREIRALARQHALTEEQLSERLARAGWRDEDISLLKTVDRTFLSISDLQQAYIFGLKDEAAVRAYLDLLGLNDDDKDTVISLYLNRIETAGADYLRSVAQALYRASEITETEYRSYLAQAHVPQQSVDLEVEASNLIKSATRKALSVADVKNGVHDGLLSDAQARTRLVAQGYQEEDAQLLIKEWHTEKAVPLRGLTEQQIITFLKSGVLTPAEAQAKLVDQGIRPQDATFIVQNTHAVVPASKHPLTPATIVSAYKNGVITQVEAQAKLQQNGVSQEEAALELRVVNVGLNRAPKIKAVKKSLSEAQVIEAYKQGLATAPWVERELVTLGYSDADASLLRVTEDVKLSGTIPDDWTVLK